MATIRVCNPVKFGMFYDFQDNKATGVYAYIVNDYGSYVEQGTNASFVVRSENDGIGQLIDKKTGEYDGCIGLIQKNQSDLMFQFTNYPLPAENVYQGQIFTESVVQFVGTYTSRQEGEAVQLESCFNSFDHLVWLLCILLALVCSLAVVLRRSLVSPRLIHPSPEDVSHPRRSLRAVLYQVVTHMASRGELQWTEGVFGKLMYSALSLFAFLVLFHFCSFIKTELVAVRPPKTLRSYRDLIKNQVGLGFIAGMDTWTAFANGAPGSEEKQMWDQTRSKYPNGEYLIKSDSKIFPWVQERMLKQEIVLVSDSMWMPFIVRSCCRHVVNEERITLTNDMGWYPMKVKVKFPLVGASENARVTLKNLIINQSTASNVVILLRRVVARLFETGIPLKLMKLVEEIDAFGIALGLKDSRLTSQGLMEECVQNIIYSPDIRMTGVMLANMRNLFRIFFALIFIAFIVLLWEIISYFATR